MGDGRRVVSAMFLGSVVLGVTATTGCGSESSGQPGPSGGALVGFTGSACKKERAAQALTAAEARAGLQCVRWAPSEGGLEITLLNFDGACGAEWEGRATTTGAGLELRAVNPGCLLAACGSCIYDWTFVVQPPAASALALTIVRDPCPGQQPPETDEVTLPLASAPSGELCRYAEAGALAWQAMALGTCGQPLMPCRTGGGMCDLGDAGAPCEAGLTCAPGASEAAAICHPTCSADADCALPGLLSCQAGLCRPVAPW